MSLVIEQTQPVPLVKDEEGQIRVTGTRVTLDTIACAFNRGATAEEISQQYSALSLADVYSVLAFLIRHHDEVTDYLNERALRQAAVRMENETRFDSQGIRARLMARRTDPIVRH